MHEESPTQQIRGLLDGEAAAAEWLVDSYYGKLVELAKKRLVSMPPQIADDEGAVISAFRSFFSGVQGGQFPTLASRDDLWKVLATLTARKALTQIRHHWRKRGDANNVKEQTAIETLASQEPSADEVVAFLEDCQSRIDALADDRLREIVLLRLQGWDTCEIAKKFNVHRRTVQRKLALIERSWNEQSQL